MRQRRTTQPDERFFILLISIGVSFSFLLGCGPASDSRPEGEPGAATKPKTLLVSQGSDLRSLDPYYALESPTFGVQVNVFEGLTTIDGKMDVVPQLAVSWKVIGDTTWEFTLRKGVRFHGGEVFDAEDVKYSVRRAIDWAPSRLRSEIPTVKEVKIINPYLVHIETTVPDAILPRRLGSLLLIDKESSEAVAENERDSWLGINANGTGPYKVKEWRRDEHCLIVRNEDYWGAKPEIEEIKFLAISNDATRIAALLNGDIDVFVHVPVNDVERVGAMPGFSVVSQPSLRLIYLGLDVGRDESPGLPDSPPNPLKDLRVRRAIYAAINEELIVEKVMGGQGQPAAQLFPASILGHDPSIERQPYDLTLAKRLMAEAGYAEGFRISLDSPNDRYVNDEAIATAIAGQLAKIKIEVAVRAVPKSRFFDEEQAGRVSFFLIGWANTNGDGNGTFDHLLHTFDREKNLGGSNTSTHYSNLEVDRLAEAAWSEFDPIKREKMLQEANRLVMRDLPHIPLHYQMDIYAVSDRVEWSPRRDTQVRGLEVKWK